MSWSQDAKQAMFGNDDDFLKWYCTTKTQELLTGVQPALARGVLWRLADAIPLAAHATPDLWTPATDPQPIVVVGRLTAGGKIREPKVGLCRTESGLYLFTRRDNVKAFPGHAKLRCFEDDWVYWRKDAKDRDYVRTKVRLDCCPSGALPKGHPLSDEASLWLFLKWIEAKQIEEKWIVAQRAKALLATKRLAHEVRFDGFGCIYPRLVNATFSKRSNAVNGIGNAL